MLTLHAVPLAIYYVVTIIKHSVTTYHEPHYVFWQTMYSQQLSEQVRAIIVTLYSLRYIELRPKRQKQKFQIDTMYNINSLTYCRQFGLLPVQIVKAKALFAHFASVFARKETVHNTIFIPFNYSEKMF